MEFDSLQALIADGGGYDKVVRLIFDNSIHVNFVTKGEGKCKESDFVKLGSEYFYKETSMLRSNDDYEYNVPLTVYHPLCCLQAVIMGDSTRLDVMSMNDMINTL